MDSDSKLSQGLKQLGFPPEKIDFLLPKMDSYIRELILFNSAYNLTNTSDYEELAVFHILDSLAAVQNIVALAQKLDKSERLHIADIGSGGGLPGIPLAAALPEYDFFLVERMDKRCAFLENEAAILGLKNVKIIKSEAERINEASFDIAVFRAFRPLDKKMIKTLLNLIKRGGFLAAYKAKIENIKSEMEEISDIVKDYQIFPLSVPFLPGHERNLIVIQKD